MSFAKVIKSKLAKYKALHFPELGDGIWSGNGESYAHILPAGSKYENLLPSYKSEFLSFWGKNQPHSDFHHLNSSQAMCFNFFFPLAHEKLLEIVTDFLGFSGEIIDYKSVRFEKDGLEAKYGRVPTSFDFYFETLSGKKFYFEIKYTENDFGRAKINQSKYDDVYSKHLIAIQSKFHSSQVFFNNYQILRNLVHIDTQSYVVFIFPQDNEHIRRQASQAREVYLEPEWHGHFYPLTWESLLSHTKAKANHTLVNKQLTDFGDKYLNA